jgi:hypothetical protein
MDPTDFGGEDDPYLDRLALIKTPLFTVYLHHIHRPDRGPDPHDHPWELWGFFSLIIAGGYEELVLKDKRDASTAYLRTRARWSLAWLRPGSAHMITEIFGLLWTIVFAGPHIRDWGFWRNGIFTSVHHYAGTEPVRRGRREKAA